MIADPHVIQPHHQRNKATFPRRERETQSPARHPKRIIQRPIQCAIQHVADDLHVAVTVRCESTTRRDCIVIDDAQVGYAHVLWVVVAAE